ncbi:MAG: CPXCG motif-containing cysteine-rich protein [Gammaproteobacteria bacterium]|nr:CPXCG motif-containing cysteine-rich protein [Gammaproteobacteria bacterium]
MNSLEEFHFDCPYCGENLSTLIDISGGKQQYIEDCQVCCCPILFDIAMEGAEEKLTIITRRENE